ncbi:MAG: zinc transporter ZntB [Magnetospiraceae bacterium]
MTAPPDLICAYGMDGAGGGTEIDWPAVNAWTPENGHLWVHLDAHGPQVRQWLRNDAKLDAFVVEGLLAEETRPRCEQFPNGVLLVLRGVNLNPGAEPEDMVSIRLWVDAHRVISTRIRQLMAVQDIRDQFAAGEGPVSAGHLVARLGARLTERMGPVLEDLGETLADLESGLIGAAAEDAPDIRRRRHQLIDLRQVAIALRRYIAPQREALYRFSLLEAPWVGDRVVGRLRETVDRITRLTEELDELRERAAIVQDELSSRVSQRMERTMYTLTLVATVMLPLGFLTGLLGINVAGMPGAETPWAFWAVCALLTILVAVEIWVLKRLKWL